MSVSVAMATYNGARFLPEQLASLAAQTVAPIELVVCDDRSSDNTATVVEAFARRAPFPVRFQVNPERLGFADNFMKAARLCSGEFVAFCDQDDRWREDKIARSREALRETGAVLCAHDATEIDEAGTVTGYYRHGLPYGLLTPSLMDPWRVLAGFTCTFRRRLLDLAPDSSRPVDVIDAARLLAHDRWVCFLASIAGPVLHLAEPLAEYRQHGANASGWMRSRRGLARSIAAVRDGFGFHLAKRWQIADTFGRVIDDILADPTRRALLTDLDHTRAARAFWQEIEANYGTRYAIAATDGRGARLLRLAGAIRSGGYADQNGTRLARRSIVQDMASVLLARPGQPRLALQRLSRLPGDPD